MENYQSALVELRSRIDKLAARRAVAQSDCDEAISARQLLLVTSDDLDETALETAQARVDHTSSKLKGLMDAIDALEIKARDCESKLRSEQDAAARAASAQKLESQLSDIETALPVFMQASRVLADSLSKVFWHYESCQLSGFIVNAMGQIEIASAMSNAELKASVEMIRNGQQAIPRDEPEEVIAPVAVIDAPAMQTIFMLRSAKYLDHRGRTRYATQFEDCEMPTEAAQRALRYSVGVLLSDERRKSLLGARGGVHVDPNAIDLADLTTEEGARPKHLGPIMASDPIAAANFTKIDRGPDRVLRIAADRAP